MPPRHTRPRELEWRLFRGSTAVRRGLLTPKQLRSRAYVHLRYDVYADARLERDHELACKAVALRLPPGVAIAGPSAAHLWGVDHAGGIRDPVHVIAPTSVWLGPRHGVRVHRADVAAEEIVRTGGVPRTTPLRTAWDVAAWCDPEAAVAIIDRMLALNVVTVDALDGTVRRRRGERSSRRAREAFALTDAGAQSPPESHVRVRLVLAGLPRPVTQHPVRVHGGRVVHPDLAWPEFKVALEYDGQWHDDPRQFHRDRDRLRWLTEVGWLVVPVTSTSVDAVRTVREALRSRGWRP
jgi:very-short-patch-repair endonuclease